jgi:hypothetical protein
VPGWLFLLCILLTIWNPASFAVVAASQVAGGFPTSRVALLLLAGRLLATGIGVAAGMSLWNLRPGAVRLAKISLALSSADVVLRMASRMDLSGAPPGTRLPLAILTVAFNGAWYAYLEKSRRVRALYDLESRRLR